MRGQMTVAGVRALMDAGALTPREAVMLCRDLCEEAFSVPLHERALERAAYAASRMAEDSARATTGVPLAVEDCLSMRGLPFACGPSEEAQYDATLVRKLDRYGALILGKTRVAPYVLGVRCSVGAAQAVALRQCAAALGVGLLPLACEAGLTAIIPGAGITSRYGMFAAAPSLARIGVIAHSALDCAVVLDALTDFDPYDPAMLRPNCYDYAQHIGKAPAALPHRPAALPLGIEAIYAACQGMEALFLPDAHKSVPCAELEEALDIGRRLARDGLCDEVQRARGRVAQWAASQLEGQAALELPCGDQSAMLAALCGLPCATAGGKLLLGRHGQEARLLALADYYNKEAGA